MTKIAADSRPLRSATLSPHRRQSPTRGSGTAGCAPQPRGGQRRRAKPRPPGGAPIRFVCLFLTLQLASSPSSSREADPAADWSASSWCEPPWPINACQSTSQARRKRLESLGAVKMGGKWAWWRRAGPASAPAPPASPPVPNPGVVCDPRY